MIYDRIKKLCKEKGVSVNQLEKDIDVSKGSLCKIDKSSPSNAKMRKIADYFNVSIDYLQGGFNTELFSGTPHILQDEISKRDLRDISKRLEETLSLLQDQQEALMFDGKAMDDTTRQLLAMSLENSLKMGKINAKEKFTPKKYKKD